MVGKDLTVEVSDLALSIGAKEVLKPLTFSLSAGESLALIGPNGAGKSSLLRLLNGIFTPTCGTIKVLGKEIQSYSARELASVVATVLPLSLEECRFSVEQFLQFGSFSRLGLISRQAKEEREILSEVLRSFRLESLRNQGLNKLSSGERQKVLIASALIQRPAVLLLDEPTSFLDPKVEVESLKALALLRRELNTTIIWVTHHLNLIPQVADRILALKSGEIVFAGECESYFKAEMMRKVFDTAFTEVRDSERNLVQLLPSFEEVA